MSVALSPSGMIFGGGRRDGSALVRAARSGGPGSAGLTGTGGGIFLSPLLLFLRWAETRQTGGVAAAFILLNSLAGLAGHPASLAHLPSELPLWAAAVVIGGFVGAEIGSRRIGTPAFRRVLGVVLLVAGAKLVFS